MTDADKIRFAEHVAPFVIAQTGTYEVEGTTLTQRPIPLIFAGLALMVVGGVTAWSLTRPGPPVPQPLAQFVITTPPGRPVMPGDPPASRPLHPQ